MIAGAEHSPIPLEYVYILASLRGIEAVKYDPVLDLWHMTDGEAYSTQVLIKDFMDGNRGSE